MDRPRRIIHIDRKTESLWQEDDTLCLVGPVNTKRYQQQLIDLNRLLLKKRSKYQKRQHKVIFLHDNTPSHTAKPVRDTLETLSASSVFLGKKIVISYLYTWYYEFCFLSSVEEKKTTPNNYSGK